MVWELATRAAICPGEPGDGSRAAAATPATTRTATAPASAMTLRRDRFTSCLPVQTRRGQNTDATSQDRTDVSLLVPVAAPTTGSSCDAPVRSPKRREPHANLRLHDAVADSSSVAMTSSALG